MSGMLCPSWLGRPCAHPSHVASLPTAEGRNRNCAMCGMCVSAEDSILLGCGHAFHPRCIYGRAGELQLYGHQGRVVMHCPACYMNGGSTRALDSALTPASSFAQGNGSFRDAEMFARQYGGNQLFQPRREQPHLSGRPPAPVGAIGRGMAHAAFGVDPRAVADVPIASGPLPAITARVGASAAGVSDVNAEADPHRRTTLYF